MKIQYCIWAAAWLTVSGASVATAADGDHATAQTAAYQASVAQEQIRGRLKFLDREIAKLLDEFKNNPVGAEELARTQKLLDRLKAIGETDMAAVTELLRAASREDDVGQNKALLVKAGTAQKKIRLALQEIVDQLALQRDEVAIAARLDALALRQAVNRRETLTLHEGKSAPGKPAWNHQTLARLVAGEQDAVAGEITLVLDTLKNLAVRGTPSARQSFAAALLAGEGVKLRELAPLSVVETGRNYPQAAAVEEQIMGGLKVMIEALHAKKPKADRLREMAASLKQMAVVEKALADKTPSMWGGEKTSFTKQQNQIADKLDLMKDELARLKPDTKPHMDAARQAVADAKQIMADKFMARAPQVSALTEKEQAAAASLQKLGENLQAAADQLNGAQDQRQDADGARQDAATQMLADALNHARQAAQQLKLAERNMRGTMEKPPKDGGSTGDKNLAQQHLDRARAMIDQAQQAAAQTGEQSAQKNFQGAGAHTKKAAERLGGNDTKKALDENVQALWQLAPAIDDLKKALDRKMAQSTQRQQQQQSAASQPPGFKPAPGAQNGALDNMKAAATAAENTSFSAINNLSPKDRENLLLLQKEKAPVEYGGMVEQYQKNLANGEFPAQ
ncbi:MAG: hypothetical protein LBK60_04900 [Verrucomicrobiales bacterium]|nr:hypothetical protein [Verrucomicrobiales bacterium]